MIIIISPLVLIAIAVAVVIGAHVTAGALIAMLAIVCASLVIAVCTAAVMATKVRAGARNADPFDRVAVEVLPPTMPAERPLPRPAVQAIEPARELHLHLHGLNADELSQATAYLRGEL